MDALCVDPSNIPAHILLGDIYFDRQLLDDAIQWYCLALDFDSSSSAARKKLALAIEQRKTLLAGSPPQLGIDFLRTLFHIRRGKPDRLIADSLERRKRIAVFFAAFVLLGAMVVWPIVASMKRSRTALSGPMRNIGVDPVFLNPFAIGKNDGDTASSAPVSLGDSSDSSLLAAIQNNQDLKSNGIKVIDVTSDPRYGRYIITFNLSSAGTEFPSRELLSRAALRVARSAYDSAGDPHPQSFTLRAVSQTQAGKNTLIFTADIAAGDASAVDSSDSTQTEAAIESHFTGIWWSPLLGGPVSVSTPSQTQSPISAPSGGLPGPVPQVGQPETTPAPGSSALPQQPSNALPGAPSDLPVPQSSTSMSNQSTG
jgi:hypothetical protein